MNFFKFLLREKKKDDFVSFWERRDLRRYKKKNQKLDKEMAKRCKKHNWNKEKNDGPYCPRCEARTWKHTTFTDDNDTYHNMKCVYCQYSWSLTH